MKLKDFYLRVDTSTPDDCWEWQGAYNNTGYGTVWIGDKCYVAHRVSAYIAGLVSELDAPKNSADKGFVLHKCDNKLCCNPKHFFIGNASDNQLDCYAKGRSGKAKGSKHANAKLTNEQIAEIRTKYAAGGIRQKDLGKEYGVSQVAIGNIVRRETYV